MPDVMNVSSLLRVIDSRGAFVSQLLNLLTSEGVNYVLVGDVRKFPFKISSDIDIVIESSSLERFLLILIHFCKQNNAHIVQVLQHEQSAWYYVCAWVDASNNVKFLHPDVCTDYFRDGVLLLSNQELLENRICDCSQGEVSVSFFTPAPAMGFAYYLLKKVDKGHISQTEGEYLSLQWQKDPEGGKRQLRRFFDKETVEFIEGVANKENWEQVQQVVSQLRSQLRKNRPFSFRHYYRELDRKVRRLRQPTGLHIAFLGMDGSGKSSILTKVSRDIAPAFRSVCVHHFRPYFGRSHANRFEPLPHAQSSRGLICSFAKLFWYLLDNTLGYGLFVFPYRIRSSLILFDRYYYDLLVDPKRYRFGGSHWLANLIGKFIPQPDLFFFLDASPQVIHGRKQEVALPEMTKLRDAYLTLAKSLVNAHVIDVSKTIEEVEYEVQKQILDFLSKRTMKRLNL